MNNSGEEDQNSIQLENKFQQGVEDFIDGEMENALEVFIELIDKNYRMEESLEYISRIQFDLFEYEGKVIFNFRLHYHHQPIRSPSQTRTTRFQNPTPEGRISFLFGRI
jgi:hypothetical protein